MPVTVAEHAEAIQRSFVLIEALMALCNLGIGHQVKVLVGLNGFRLKVLVDQIKVIGLGNLKRMVKDRRESKKFLMLLQAGSII